MEEVALVGMQWGPLHPVLSEHVLTAGRGRNHTHRQYIGSGRPSTGHSLCSRVALAILKVPVDEPTANVVASHFWG